MSIFQTLLTASHSKEYMSLGFSLLINIGMTSILCPYCVIIMCSMCHLKNFYDSLN